MGRRTLVAIASMLAVVGTAACRREQVAVQRDPTPATSITSTPSVVPRLPPDLRVVLLRTMCHGECPAYAVVIDASGHVTFIGQAFVMTARGEATLAEADLRKLVAAIDEARFFSLADVNSGWKDCSRSKTTITLAGKNKVVRDGCVGAGEDDHDVALDAQRLEKLGEEIDRFVGTERWIGPEDKRQRLFDEPDAATAKTTIELDYFR